MEHIKKYHPMGIRTLFMLILNRSIMLVFLWPAFFAVLILLDYVPVVYVDVALKVTFGFFIFNIAMTVIVFCFGLLEYYRYWIFIDDKDLKIARGLIAIEQIGLPYRYIKDLKIERSLVDQMVGVSDIIITTIGDDDSPSNGPERNIFILPAVYKNTALEIQDIVLKKVQVEQVKILGGRLDR